LTIVLKTLAFFTLIGSSIGSGLGLAGHISVAPVHAPAHYKSVHSYLVTTVDDFLTPVDVHAQPAPDPAASEPDPTPTDQPAQPAAPVAAATVVALKSAPPAVAPAPPVPPAPPAPAPPAIVVGSGQQALINQDRAAAGLPPLNWSGCLASIAAGQANAMAASGSIFHGNGVQQDWGCGLGSSQTGENVGVWGSGINDAGINQLFMASAPHRANIMGPYHYVGTAWVVSSSGKGYIAVEFA
jgi:uncharacterized protein YkwD